MRVACKPSYQCTTPRLTVSDPAERISTNGGFPLVLYLPPTAGGDGIGGRVRAGSAHRKITDIVGADGEAVLVGPYFHLPASRDVLSRYGPRLTPPAGIAPTELWP